MWRSDWLALTNLFEHRGHGGWTLSLDISISVVSGTAKPIHCGNIKPYEGLMAVF